MASYTHVTAFVRQSIEDGDQDPPPVSPGLIVPGVSTYVISLTLSSAHNILTRGVIHPSYRQGNQGSARLCEGLPWQVILLPGC